MNDEFRSAIVAARYEEAWKIAYSAGAEQMRERAAREAQYYSLPSPTARSIMRAIKSLPIGESSRAPQEKP